MSDRRNHSWGSLPISTIPRLSQGRASAYTMFPTMQHDDATGNDTETNFKGERHPFGLSKTSPIKLTASLVSAHIGGPAYTSTTTTTSTGRMTV